MPVNELLKDTILSTGKELAYSFIHFQKEKLRRRSIYISDALVSLQELLPGGGCHGRNVATLSCSGILFSHPQCPIYQLTLSALLPPRGWQHQKSLQLSLFRHSLLAPSIPYLPPLSLQYSSTLLIHFTGGLPLTPPPSILLSYTLFA